MRCSSTEPSRGFTPFPMTWKKLRRKKSGALRQNIWSPPTARLSIGWSRRTARMPRKADADMVAKIEMGAHRNKIPKIVQMMVVVSAAVIAFWMPAFAQKEAPLPKGLPPYGPEKTLQAPEVKIFKLANGLTLWLVPRPGFPKTAFSLAMRGGLAADPGGLPGISELLVNAIDQGTKTRSARQIAEEFQGTGGELQGFAGKDATVLSVGVLSSRMEPALAVLADVVENASFPDAEVAVAKKQLAD